jgi:hypothetical protein
MSDSDRLSFRPRPAEEKLVEELKRFSFGVAVSPLAEVTPIEGPDEFVRTKVSLGGISIDHAQHPETPQHNITATGEKVAKNIAGVHFIFDSANLILMPGFGLPAPEEITAELANTIGSLNNDFEALA